MILKPFLEANRIEAGCDEVGERLSSGTSSSCAVILPADYANPWINDSKKLGKRQREDLIGEIKEKSLAWKIAEASVAEIDKINILNASFLAMTRAVQGLKLLPEHLLIDGNRWKSKLTIPHTCVIKGDGKYANIAAASILAKVHRDKFMEKLAEEFPHYAWERNAGYPTKAHRYGIEEFGDCIWHRKSFRLLKEQLELKI